MAKTKRNVRFYERDNSEPILLTDKVKDKSKSFPILATKFRTYKMIPIEEAIGRVLMSKLSAAQIKRSVIAKSFDQT